MPRVHVTDVNGEKTSLDLSGNQTLMEELRSHDIEGIWAICGGLLACATCHVYLDETSCSAIDPPSESERSLLDGSDVRRATSRLSCQIVVGDLPSEVHLTVAPEE